MTPPNGQKFDKLMRGEALRKDDDALKTLRKLSPAMAKTVDDIDMKFADILARLQRIEDAHEEHARLPARILPAREPNGDEVLREMGRMTPEMRASLLSKLKQ
jgi:hypothetical protein